MGGRAVGEAAVEAEAEEAARAFEFETVFTARTRFPLFPPCPPVSLPPFSPAPLPRCPAHCTYSRSPSRPPSRPKPLSRYPPKPLAASNTLVQFTHTVPALSWGAMSRARLMFSVQTLAARP